MFEKTKEALFLEKKFSEYYSGKIIDTVPEVEKREFGFGIYKKKIANRNLAFKNKEEMNSYLREKTPLFFSYSNSYYKYPRKTPMSAKEWIASDLIYEFDADEITTRCEKKNDVWKCYDIKESLVKETVDGDDTKQWFLKDSLEEAKKQVFRLAEFLEKDFGFEEEPKINFSGKAGYHLHLRDKQIQKLNKRSRIELVNYLTAQGIHFESLGYEFEKQLICSKKRGRWVERLNNGLKDFFEKTGKEISLITEISPTKANQLLKNKKEIIKGIENGYLFSVGERTNKKFWQKTLDHVAQTYKIPIDRQTSIDLHKIIRVPNTLHGETGLIAKQVSLEKLKDFDPFTETIAFDSSPVKVFVEKAPKFVLKGEKFGPFEKETVEVPLYCAIFLIGKGCELR